MLRFIHIGKTGGSTLLNIFKDNNLNIPEYHFNKNYKLNEKYIIWLRNPLTRFVSAFNMEHHFITFDYKNMNVEDVTKKNCMWPKVIRNLIISKRNYVIHPRFDELIRFFENANSLAESLTSTDIERKEKAVELMNFNTKGHIFRGIGWYLNNGVFVKRRNDNIIFVGKMETMNEDIDKLKKVINNPLKIRNSTMINSFSPKQSKYLSPLAIQNLIDFYKTTDYAALIELNKHGWITDEVLALYYTYP
jgi:hypothetical protein